MRRILSAVLLISVNTVFANELVLDGLVVGVTDGDTLTVLDTNKQQHEIRLAAIDSPETSCHARRPGAWDDRCVEQGQPFGHSAKQSLSSLVFNKTVHVVLQPAVYGSLKADSSYGREIGTVFVDGVDANLLQVTRGYAWHYTQFASKWQSRAEYNQYAAAEDSARNRHMGLWANNSPIPPWNYRHSQSAKTSRIF